MELALADGSEFPATAGRNAPTSPFQGDSIGITGSARIMGDVEWTGTSSGTTLSLPLAASELTNGSSSSNSISVGPMVAVSARLDGFVAPGFGLSTQSSSNVAARLDLERTDLAPIWSGQGAVAVGVNPDTQKIEAYLFQAEADRGTTGAATFKGVSAVTSAMVPQSAPKLAGSSTTVSCHSVSTRTAMCGWIGQQGTSLDNLGDVMITMATTTTSAPTRTATMTLSATKVPHAWFGTSGLRDGATGVAVAALSPAGPAGPHSGIYTAMVLVSL